MLAMYRHKMLGNTLDRKRTLKVVLLELFALLGDITRVVTG